MGSNSSETNVEMALSLYAEGKLSPGRAAEIAQITRWEFADLVRKRGIPTPYTREMIEEDFANASRH